MYITTEYEAEEIVGRIHGTLTITGADGMALEFPVTIVSYDWGRVKPGAAVATFACGGQPTAQWAFAEKDSVSVDVDALFDELMRASCADIAAQMDRDILGEQEE